jgi:hypothetical protein
MTATNHALTGAIIGTLLVNPLVAVPLAVVAHFALDAIPHFGRGAEAMKDTTFAKMLLADATLCVILAGIIAIAHPTHWPWTIVAAFACTSPDLMWAKRYLSAKKSGTVPKPKGPLQAFHSKIQWFERPIGAVVEIAWAGAAIFILATLLHK